MNKLFAADTVIEVNQVEKSFKKLKAVDQVSFHIRQGEFVALLGPNGAGKTTLVEMIEGIQFPDAGEIRILGKTWRSHEKELRNLMGIALQETQLLDKLTVREMLALFVSFYEVPASRTDEILEMIGLTSKRKDYVEHLSGGQRQRLVFGISIINHPQILLLDEPTTGLDPHARREIWKLLVTLKAQGMTLILTTHYMEEAEYLCERILMLDQGKILAQGTLRELLSSQRLQDTIQFTLNDYLAPEYLASLPEGQSVHWKISGISGQLSVNNIAATLPEFLDLLNQNRLSLVELECRKNNLDDLFIAMTGRRLDE